ncbi:hypothetical protein Pcinc_008300 [Petrolisthes cinctipes]|uniref:Uncharacterized protein n=1 Tax=Petrolisthes cinctipes TaxID=88211 RepID=A0AAE1G9I3_PETCI|nr:hypothetical protein Pcinc_008300 [Petrolisthes cinctipes]
MERLHKFRPTTLVDRTRFVWLWRNGLSARTIAQQSGTSVTTDNPCIASQKLKWDLWRSDTSVSGACAACVGWPGRSKAVRMISTSSQERVGRESRCCAQKRMSSMAKSVRNERLWSGGLPADFQLALWTTQELMPPAFNMP